MQWLPKNNSVKLNFMPVKSCTMSFGFLQMNHTEIQEGNFATAILHEITSNLHGCLELLIKLPPKNVCHVKCPLNIASGWCQFCLRVLPIFSSSR